MLEGSLDPPPSPFHARELQARIDAALERVPATWGVLVHSTTLGDLAIREPDAALVPASCVKLFTAMAALHARDVGPRRTLDTTARVVPDAAGPGWSTATLAVRPSGDPTLTGDALDALVARAALSSRVPIERIVAASLEGDEWCDEGAPGPWEVGDLRHAWAAPPSRACVDGNAECCAASPATFARNPLAPKRLRQTRRGGAREGEGYECSYRHRADAPRSPPTSARGDASSGVRRRRRTASTASPRNARRLDCRSPVASRLAPGAPRAGGQRQPRRRAAPAFLRPRRRRARRRALARAGPRRSSDRTARGRARRRGACASRTGPACRDATSRRPERSRRSSSPPSAVARRRRRRRRSGGGEPRRRRDGRGGGRGG